MVCGTYGAAEHVFLAYHLACAIEWIAMVAESVAAVAELSLERVARPWRVWGAQSSGSSVIKEMKLRCLRRQIRSFGGGATADAAVGGLGRANSSSEAEESVRRVRPVGNVTRVAALAALVRLARPLRVWGAESSGASCIKGMQPWRLRGPCPKHSTMFSLSLLLVKCVAKKWREGCGGRQPPAFILDKAVTRR